MTVSSTSAPAETLAAVPPGPVVPLTVEQYHEMARTGILLDGDPIELLGGCLVKKKTKHPSHSASTAKTRRNLDRIVPDGWSVDAQEPITTDYGDRHVFQSGDEIAIVLDENEVGRIVVDDLLP